jgi:hypothetical protein
MSLGVTPIIMSEITYDAAGGEREKKGDVRQSRAATAAGLLHHTSFDF